MKRFFTVLTVVSVVGMLAASAYGQGAGPRQGGQGGQGGGQRQGGQRGQQNPEFMKKLTAIQTKVMKQVGLTASQQTQVTAANKKMQEETQKQMQAMMQGRQNGQQPDRAKMQAARKKITDAHTASLTKIMGKDKYAQYDKLMKAEMEKLRKEMGMGQRGGGQGGARGGAAAGGGAAKSKSTGGGI